MHDETAPNFAKAVPFLPGNVRTYLSGKCFDFKYTERLEQGAHFGHTRAALACVLLPHATHAGVFVVAQNTSSSGVIFVCLISLTRLHRLHTACWASWPCGEHRVQFSEVS